MILTDRESVELNYVRYLGFRYIARNEIGSLTFFKEKPVRDKEVSNKLATGHDTWVIGSYPIKDYSLYGEIKLGKYEFITWNNGVWDIDDLLDSLEDKGSQLYYRGENVTLEHLKEMRANYISKNLGDFKFTGNVDIVYITDEELLKKINSAEFKLHPTYPTLVNKDGTEVYDIRDNFRMIIGQSKESRPKYTILKYKQSYVHRLVAETWHQRLIKESENVHHIDGNNKNNYYTNLQIICKKKHIKKHESEGKIFKRIGKKNLSVGYRGFNKKSTQHKISKNKKRA